MAHRAVQMKRRDSRHALSRSVRTCLLSSRSQVRVLPGAHAAHPSSRARSGAVLAGLLGAGLLAGFAQFRPDGLVDLVGQGALTGVGRVQVDHCGSSQPRLDSVGSGPGPPIPKQPYGAVGFQSVRIANGSRVMAGRHQRPEPTAPRQPWYVWILLVPPPLVILFVLAGWWQHYWPALVA